MPFAVQASVPLSALCTLHILFCRVKPRVVLGKIEECTAPIGKFNRLDTGKSWDIIKYTYKKPVVFPDMAD